MELLERVVRQDDRSDPIGHLQDECIAPADGPGRRRDQLGIGHGLIEFGTFGRIDAVAEGGIHDDGEASHVVLGEEGLHRFVELGEAGQRARLGGDVGAVNDDVIDAHGYPLCLGGRSPVHRSVWRTISLGWSHSLRRRWRTRSSVVKFPA